MIEDNNIDKAFKEKLEGFSVTPPPHVWQNVQGQLAAGRRGKRVAVYRWLSAAAVLILAILAGWYFTGSNRPAVDKLSDAKILQKESGIQKSNNNITREIEKPVAGTEHSLIVSTAEKKGTKTYKSQSIVKHVAVEENNIIKFSESEREEILTAIKARTAFIAEVKPGVKLAEYYENAEDFALTETDRMLIAYNAENLRAENKNNMRWKMGLNVVPGYSSQVANHSAMYDVNMKYTGETGNNNIGGGFSVQYKTGKRFSVETGVYYAQNGQKPESSYRSLSEKYSYETGAKANYMMADVAMVAPLNNTATRAAAPSFSNKVKINNGQIVMNGNAGVVAVNSLPKGTEITTKAEVKSAVVPNTMVTNGEFAQVFDFVEIPLLMRYRVLDRKFGIELVGGVNAGIVVANNAYIDNSYGVQNIGSTQDVSSVNLSGAVGVGFNYEMGKHFSVAVEPRLNYYLNSINNSPDVDYHPYRVGIYSGIYYTF